MAVIDIAFKLRGWWILGPFTAAPAGVVEVFCAIKYDLETAPEQTERTLTGFSVRSLTDLAAWLAGPKRLAVRDEWRAHLAGGSGHDPVTWRKVGQALGFVASAVRLRLADAADQAWRPADAVLGSRTLSNLFVGGPVIMVLFAIVHHDGRFGLVADIQDAGEVGAFLYGVIRVGRWWRQIKLPEPKPRRAKE